MSWRPLVLGLALLVVVALPFALRPAAAPVAAEAVLVVITPHNEAIRSEFAHAFAAWHQRERGVPVAIDWRSPGGTADIVRYVDGAYAAQPDGIGIDIAFGGGQFEFARWAERGILVDAGVALRHPQWFGAGGIPDRLGGIPDRLGGIPDRLGGIPDRLGGEILVDPQRRYYGACLASFGICSNPLVCAAEGLPEPRQWADLAAPAFRDRLALADPTRSGSVNRAFELMIQQAMAARVGEVAEPDAALLDAGWNDGLLLIKRLVGNARSIADAATGITLAVARGDAAAGICIDFYGRAQAQWTAERSGQERVRYVTPAGGTSISADPIALLRGAPHPELARLFIDFVLSPEGQQLWNDRVGLPGGPQRYALRRWPIQPVFYRDPARRARMTDAEEDPYALGTAFTYRGAWTGPHFTLIRWLIKAAILDAGVELRAAWAAICEAGGPEVVPEAMAALRHLPFAHHQAAAVGAHLKELADDDVARARELRAWTDQARAAYRAAAALAEAGR